MTQSVPPPPAAKLAPEQKKSAEASKGDESVAGLEHRVSVHTDAKGRKWLGDVPYDVFFDHPLEVAAEGAASTKPGSPPATVAANPTPVRVAEKSPATTEKRPASGPNDWGRLVDIDILDAEVKRIRNDLAAHLQSVAKYNSHCQEIAVSGATLATVAQIVAEHSGSVSWKANAPLVRDLGTKIHDSAHGPGASALHATKAAYEQLVDVLDGNASGGTAAQPQRDFSEVEIGRAHV